MSREYDAETLKAVQNIELEILESFLEICEKQIGRASCRERVCKQV